MNGKMGEVNKEEFDRKVTWVMKYGLLGAFVITVTIILLETLTGSTGKVAEYSIVVASITGFLIAAYYTIKIAITLQRRTK